LFINYKYLYLYQQTKKEKQNIMKTATFTNTQTNETHQINGVKNIGQAWNLSKVVCSQMNWNNETFAMDVKVSVK
jgi:hypothetical protein